MVLVLLGCPPPGTIYPTDACRVPASLSALDLDLQCGDHAAWDRTIAVGGVGGESYDGLSWFAVGESADGEALAIGYRPDGALAAEVAGDLAGFDPLDPDTEVDCGATIEGLPDELGGRAEFAGAEAGTAPAGWSLDVPEGCGAASSSWRGLILACGTLEAYWAAPDRFVVTTDTLGAPTTVDATWGAAVSASCEGEAPEGVTARLYGSPGALRLQTPLGGALGDGLNWTSDDLACGCSGDVFVDGVPSF